MLSSSAWRNIVHWQRCATRQLASIESYLRIFLLFTASCNAKALYGQRAKSAKTADSHTASANPLKTN
jgi:hypothetical protein